MEKTIYKITSKIDGKVYIGCSKNYNKRKREHINDLKRGKHHSLNLQNSFNINGIDNFEFEIIEEVENKIAGERERYWISYYDSMNEEKGFNNESGGNKGKKMSIQTLKKQSEVQKKTYKNTRKYLMSPAAREKARLKMLGANNPAYGKTPKERMNEETYKKWIEKKKILLSTNNPMKGKHHTNESKEKIRNSMLGEKNHFYGKHHTKETKKKLSELKKDNPSNARKVFCKTTSETFNTITEAANKYNIDGSSISKCCRGKLKRCGKLEDGTPLIFEYIQ